MYPYAILKIGDKSLLTLYELFILVGVLAAFLLADRMTQKRGFSVALQKIVIVAALAAVVLGYGSAVLFQAFYNFMETGRFEIVNNTGSTFYGGLIGGAAVFLLVYFLAGKRFCKEKEAVKKFPEMLNIGACCVPLAHAFGRIGCLMAGCCHGAETEAWYGINMYAYTILSTGEEVWHRVVPVQLFESIFLFALAAVLIVLFYKNTGRKKFPLMPVYCAGYGVWRFLIEFARADDRGATIVSFLTPSQLIALILIVVGVIYFSLWFFRRRKNASEGEALDPSGEAEAATESEGAPADLSEPSEPSDPSAPSDPSPQA